MLNTIRQLFSFILPVMVLIVVPLLVEKSWLLALDWITIAGFVVLAAGLGILVTSVVSMIRIGKGTLAPWDPAVHLIVTGLYAHTRNPMITGVLITLLGESMMVHSLPIFFWMLGFFAFNNIYFSLVEEPLLIKWFGEEYLEYRKNVPRWIPRLRPWKQG